MVFVGRDTHFAEIRQKFAFLAHKFLSNQIPSIPGVFFTIPGDLEITPHFWRLPEIPGDLAGLVIPNQHFKSTLLGGGEGVTKKSTLCTLVKMMTIMDDPLYWNGHNLFVRQLLGV